jgi:hypothetical protein
MPARIRPFVLALTVVAGASVALAQVAPLAPQLPGPGGMPPKVTLTKDSVERLLKAIPEVTQEGAAQHQKMMKSMESGAPAQPNPEDMKRMQALFSKHGFSMEDFAVQMSTLIATYMTLDPAALDTQIPNESSPEVKQALADPTLTAEQKTMIKERLAEAQKGKEGLRAQFAQIATDDNKAAVKPYMAQIKKVLAAAESEA